MKKSAATYRSDRPYMTRRGIPNAGDFSDSNNTYTFAGLPHDIHRSHHFVVFVLQDVAVPDELVTLPRNHRRSRRHVELHGQRGHRARIGLDGVFVSMLFFRRRSLWRAHKLKLTSGVKLVLVEGLAADHLKLHQMNVFGMRIAGIVDQVPYFRRSRFRVLGD